MKTDSLFYELFKLHPQSLFELAGLEADGEYIFESITVKSTEKRMDGFFRRDRFLPMRFCRFSSYLLKYKTRFSAPMSNHKPSGTFGFPDA